MAMRRRKKLDIPGVKKQVIGRLARGEAQKDIAKDYNVSQCTISRFKERNHDEIQRQAERYIEVLPDIAQQDMEDIRKGIELKKYVHDKTGTVECPIRYEDSDNIRFFLKQYEDKTADIKKSLGIYSSHNPSPVFVNIYQQNNANFFTPAVREILDKYMEEGKKFLDMEVMEDGEIQSEEIHTDDE